MKAALTFLILYLSLSGSVFSQFLSPQVDSIPMRDGKKLAADSYLPDGGTIPRPTILIQTPYNRLLYRWGLPLGIGIQIDQCNYNIVIVDWRGSFGSSGAAVSQPNRGYDGYDAVEWVATQPWSDGNVGTWGPSALGKVQYQTAKEDPPHLKCIAPLVAAPYFRYSEYYPGGVLRTEYVQQLDILGFGLGLFIYPNPYYNILWQYAENNSNYPQSIKVPCLMIGGWYDHNINEMCDFFNAIKTSSPVAVRNKHKFLIGPWVHGGHSTANVGSAQQGELSYPLAAGWSDSLAMMFFDFYMRGVQNNWESNSPVIYYRMGEESWNQSASWPPSGLQGINFYLNDNHTLTTSAPNSTSIWTTPYNPSDPSPTIGGATLRTDLLQGPYDQSLLVESRSDADVFTSETLSDPVYIYGKPVVTLHIRSDRKDTDFAIRLCDVYPDGRSMLLTDGIKRCRFLNGYSVSDTASLSQGVTYETVIELSHLSHVFMPGHKIRLTVTGSNYPRYDNNLNNGGAMYSSGDTLIAYNTIESSITNPSKISFQGNIIISTDGILNDNEIVVFPNPAEDFIFHPGFVKNDIWIITDTEGRYICELKSEDYKTNVGFLSPGVYIITNMSNGVTFKIIRQND